MTLNRYPFKPIRSSYSYQLDQSFFSILRWLGGIFALFTYVPHKRRSRLSPPVKYFTDRSKAVLLLWIFCVFCLVLTVPLFAPVYMCLVVTCWERADLLALVCGVLL